ncbi:MAG: phosphoribosylanthranilate isomerase [Oscillospiraceae bacterium]|nr:phosphoribosylanthranilate isomerase [Oscillospiraceae bacterium]
MITSCFSFQYPDEALECISVGLNWCGLLSGDDRCPAAISLAQAKKVFDAIGNKATKVAILMFRDEQKVLEAAQMLRPDVLHLCDDTVFATSEFCKKAKTLVPGMRVMQGIAVGGPETMESALADAKSYEGTADFLMLDSFVPGTSEVGATPNGVGAAGITHDWNVSARIVREVNIPVILAGGLWGENVGKAIATVHPYGVDSLTRTEIVREGVYIRKDTALVKKFVENAHKAAGRG